MFNRSYFFLLVILAFLTACQQPKEFDSPTYLGGHIINAKSNAVILSFQEEILDTLLLDANHRFLKAVPVFEEGLYTFQHGNEFQYIFLEPGDSIVMRINTWDFDESLVYSGKGGMRNEYLIDLFIENEKEDSFLRNLFYLDSKQLKQEIERLRENKHQKLDKFLIESQETNNLYIRYARAAIDYPLYRKMEVYPLMKKSYLNLVDFPQVSDNFYDYRKNIELNDPILANFYTHRNYVLSYTYHLAYESNALNPQVSVHSNLLHIVNDSIYDPELKSNLMNSVLQDEFFSNASLNLNRELIHTYMEISEDEEMKNQIDLLIRDSEQVPNGGQLKDFNVMSYNYRPFDIRSIIANRNSVIYFWSETTLEPLKLARRIQLLQRKFPSILFIGINIDGDGMDDLSPKTLAYSNKKYQFTLNENSDAQYFTKSKYSRSILVNRRGNVLDNYGNISSGQFEKSLKVLEKN
jgi:hypothetical protein